MITSILSTVISMYNDNSYLKLTCANCQMVQNIYQKRSSALSVKMTEAAFGNWKERHHIFVMCFGWKNLEIVYTKNIVRWQKFFYILSKNLFNSIFVSRKLKLWILWISNLLCLIKHTLCIWSRPIDLK